MNNRRMAGKVLQWNYDDILAKSDQKCCFSLTRRDVALIMAITEQMHWKTRYLSPTGANINTDLIDAWASGLETRLMDGCCPDGTLARFDGSVYQTSVDGGATWQDTPDSDPRNQAVASPPLPGSGDNVKCAAADNARDQYLAMRDNLVALLTAGTTVIAIVAGILGFIGVVMGISGAATAIGVLLTGLAAELLSLTPTSVTDQIDSTALDKMRCILYCRMEANGQLTYADWQGVLSDIDTEFTGFPHTFFYSITNSLGYIGVSNLGVIGVSTADDCSGCDCECGGETVGLTIDVYFGGDVVQTGCNIQADSLVDGSLWSVSCQWDGTHPFKLTAEGILSGTVGSPSQWQHYLADGSGPFIGTTAPIGISLQALELSGHADTGGTFRVSWDVATP